MATGQIEQMVMKEGTSDMAKVTEPMAKVVVEEITTGEEVILVMLLTRTAKQPLQTVELITLQSLQLKFKWLQKKEIAMVINVGNVLNEDTFPPTVHG